MLTKFEHEISDIIWIKIKGKLVPDHYSDEDRKNIIDRYWVRAMESETYVDLDEFRKRVSAEGEGR